MLQYMLRDEVWQGVHCELDNLSEGLHVVYDRAAHEFRQFTFHDEPVADADIFTVGMQNFHYKNMRESFRISPRSHHMREPSS